MRALVFERFGGPEVLEYREVADPAPASGEVLVRTKAIGLNFADIYRRRGNYHLVGSAPWILGYEAAGVIEETGDRVAFVDSPRANAELVAVPHDRVIPLPDFISFEQAASVLLQGLTAQFLVNDSYTVRAGQTVLVHAAAGGVGSMLLQMLRSRGANVVALVSTPEKADIARGAGASHAALFDSDWRRRVLEIVGDRGFDVVYDSVGSTLSQSLDVTKKGGTVVFYGMAGGDPEPVDPRRLMDESKTLTGGDLWNVLISHEERVARANELFNAMRSGSLSAEVFARFPLSEGAKAHELLESRRSAGKIVLIP
jgi:NADPH2:quinone reductase